MKLASLRHGRDGRLCVVSRDLTRMLPVDQLLPTLQMALDSWNTSAPKLQAVYDALNKGEVSGAIAFDADKLASPLPRAYQWCDGSAYLNHVELVRKAQGRDAAGIPARSADVPGRFGRLHRAEGRHPGRR